MLCVGSFAESLGNVPSLSGHNKAVRACIPCRPLHYKYANSPILNIAHVCMSDIVVTLPCNRHFVQRSQNLLPLYGRYFFTYFFISLFISPALSPSPSPFLPLLDVFQLKQTRHGNHTLSAMQHKTTNFQHSTSDNDVILCIVSILLLYV